MAITQAVAQFEQTFIAHEMAELGRLPVSHSFSMTDHVVDAVVRTASDGSTWHGMAAQLVSVYSEAKTLAHIRDGVRRIIVAGLPHEGYSSAMVAKIVDKKLPELAGYPEMSFRWMLKSASLSAMVAIAASGAHPDVVLRILMANIRAQRAGSGWASRTWGTFNTDYDFDAGDVIARLTRSGLFSNSGSITEACAYWPEGPFPNGFSAQPTTAASESSVTVAPTITVAQPAAVHNSTPSTTTQPTTNQGTTSMTTNTTPAGIANVIASNSGNGIASALSNINPALAPVLDSILGQVAPGMTLATVTNEVLAKVAAEMQLAQLKTDSEATITTLRKQLAQAASTPSISTVTSHAKGVPNGKVEFAQASSIFPEMGQLTLTIPHFVWDAPHPDVPAADANYIFRKDMLVKALRCLARNEPFWCVGHTGSGKTTFIEQIASRLGWPVARIAFDAAVDRAELVGRMQLIPDGKGGTESKWLPGIIERALVGNYIILCDEMDAGHPNSLYVMQPVLEGKPLTLLEDGGRVVLPSPLSRLVATGNTAGNGDPSGLYPACRILSAATLDRFKAFIEVPYMTKPEEMRLLSDAAPGLSKVMLGKMVKFGAEMRAAFVKGEVAVSYSPRRSIAFARAVDDFQNMGITDETTAVSMAFREKLYDAASDEFRQRITEVANAAFGAVDPTIKLS